MSVFTRQSPEQISQAIGALEARRDRTEKLQDGIIRAMDDMVDGAPRFLKAPAVVLDALSLVVLAPLAIAVEGMDEKHDALKRHLHASTRMREDAQNDSRVQMEVVPALQLKQRLSADVADRLAQKGALGKLFAGALRARPEHLGHEIDKLVVPAQPAARSVKV